MTAAAWAVPSPASKYGAAFLSPGHVTRDDTPLARAAGPADNDNSALSVHSPMFWVGVVLAGAVGLAAASTTVRVGPVKGSVSVGDLGK
ncbi:hypothetical protein OG762_52455 (plasmid) [Streptomyces sp. NBC_01136]|uniref:hypothetical protein n=1 Tax=Streptomyces sp. NBC_01136 TaxID=2903754 RepID=UPI0037DDA260|nr:hypothetical protein OG762_52455 [Streptomyces sp. NBC_01136]